jgi:predicted nucleotidyltransferase component of viral defense system
VRDKPYASAREFRLSANAHMKRIARSGRPSQEVNREFVLQRFLARIFREPDSPWVLKGGTGLLVRLPRARYSDDVDLLYPTDNIDLARPLGLLRETLAQPHEGDFFRFEISRVDERTAVDAEKALAALRVTAYIGTTGYQRFVIDLSVKKRMISTVDRFQPQPVVVLPGVPELPEFSLYALADQIADKLCAMYEVHGVGVPSTRHHDLVDLVLIVTSSPGIDAASTTAALRAEAQHRDLALPGKLHAPGDQWPAGYRTEAVKAKLPANLHELDHALSTVGACLAPLLAGDITDGTWDITNHRWTTDLAVRRRSTDAAIPVDINDLPTAKRPRISGRLDR